ncbi:unnamed protein product, partial [Rotaria sp. Silwood2]
MASVTSEKLNDVTIFGIGNPLLDISAEVPMSLLEGYSLKPNEPTSATEETKN